MALKTETVVQKFVEIREQRAVLKRVFEEEDFKLKEAMNKIEVWLMRKLETEQLELMRTLHGTVYTSIEMKASCADWASFWPWIYENKQYDMLEKRVSVGAIKRYMEENSELPPFVNTTTEKVVRVRRT